MMLSNQNGNNGIKINGNGHSVKLDNSSTPNVNIKSIHNNVTVGAESISSANINGTNSHNHSHNHSHSHSQNQNITIPATINLPALQSVSTMNNNSQSLNGSKKRNLPNSFNTNLTLNGVNEPKNKRQKTSQMSISPKSKSNSLSLPSLLNNANKSSNYSMNIGPSNTINTKQQTQSQHPQNHSKANSISLR